jgi:hypothetical protein
MSFIQGLVQVLYRTNEKICGSYSASSIVRVVKLRRLLKMGWKCWERRNATEKHLGKC